MAREILLDGDRDDGLKEFLSYDDLTDTLTIRTEQDVEPIIEANKLMQTDGSGGWSESREWRRTASVPVTIVMAWARELGLKNMWEVMGPEYAAWRKRRMNDPDNRAFRTDSNENRILGYRAPEKKSSIILPGE